MGQEKLGRPNEDLIRAMGAFGGGIASTGGTCGCLLGGVALISSLFSRGNLEETEDPNMWRASFKLSRKFDELCAPFGGTDCRRIAQVNWSDREAVKSFYNDADSRRTICAELVGDTARALGEILEKYA
ncbi:MAG: C-GCAxxG-C-C family protein [Proteobacteria bacterium]|nr:C-GCAxxG-C-C family protein [Pseudomonadota bacterium]